MKLPSTYVDEMKRLLGEDMDAYEAALQQPFPQGLRINTTKISTEDFKKLAPFPVKSIPWIPNGFFYDEDTSRVSKHPYYFAGLYYLQEPSAMTPARTLPVAVGDRILDMCSAPGGKATELGARLKGEGFLIANDISAGRVKALLKNIELFGIANACILSEDPARLCEVYPEFFDKVLLDAPCSGEGMFRREPRMIKNWEYQGPDYYSKIQKGLIIQAAHMLKPGGMLLYSTCTFSIKENEEVIAHLLSNREDMELVPVEAYQGFTKGYTPGSDSFKKASYDRCIRIFPHKMEGEGHFLALLHKKEKGKDDIVTFPVKSQEQSIVSPEVTSFLSKVRRSFTRGTFHQVQEKLYYIPEGCVLYKQLRYLRSGLYLGDVKKQRFEPSQALAMSLTREEYEDVISLTSEDVRTRKYLKGETIDVTDLTDNQDKGWHLVCVDGYPLGWGKLNQGILKNKYYSGWRLR